MKHDATEAPPEPLPARRFFAIAEFPVRVMSVVFCERRLPGNFRYA
jgi:hypothetical protein